MRAKLLLALCLISLPASGAWWCWRDVLDAVFPPEISFRVAVPEEETGAPVLLLHGAGAHGGAWKKLVPLLLEAGHRVITPDARGSGKSVYSGNDFSPWTVSWDFSRVLRGLRLPPVHLVGHSLGGRTGVAMAYRYPRQVKSVTVLDLALHRSLRVVNDPENSAEIKQSWDVDLLSIWKRLATPTLFIATNPDLGGYVSARRRAQLAEARPLHKFIYFDDIGHPIHQEHPDRLRDTLIQFWEDLK